VYIGDSPVDFETARAASVPFIAYKNNSLDAAFHLDRMLDLLSILNAARGSDEM
jgi:phosphoglycolate phosphatase-like HAD superfamily hydrolase